MINFEINDNYGEVSLMYTVDFNATLDDVAINMIKSQTPNFLISFSIVYFNDNKIIKYNVKRYISLQNYISTPLNEYKCLNLFIKLLSPFIECTDWLLDENLLYMDLEKIYFDSSQNSIRYLYIPVINQKINAQNFREFFQKIALNIKKSSENNFDTLMNEIIAKLVEDDCSVESLYLYLKKLLENCLDNTPIITNNPVSKPDIYANSPKSNQFDNILSNDFDNISKKSVNDTIFTNNRDTPLFDLKKEETNSQANKLNNFKKFFEKLHKNKKNTKPILLENEDVISNNKQSALKNSLDNIKNSKLDYNDKKNIYSKKADLNKDMQVNIEDIFDSPTITSNMISNINKPNIVLSLISSIIEGVPENINININTDNNSYTMGRKDLLNDISKQDTNIGRISKIHVRFTRSQDGYNIADISSGNYVFINDVLIANNIPKKICINDTISLGILDNQKIVTYKVTYCD